MKKMIDLIKQWDELNAFLETSVMKLVERIKSVVEADESYIDLERDVGVPASYKGWTITDMKWLGDCLLVSFECHTPYEDFVEYEKMWIMPEWWEMSDDDLLSEIKQLAEFNRKEQEIVDMRQMKALAMKYGYIVKKDM